MKCTGKTGKATNNMYEQRPGNFSSAKKLPYKSISIKIHIPTEIVYSTRLLIDPLNYFFLNRVTNNPNAGPIAIPIPAPIATLPKAAPIPAPRATPKHLTTNPAWWLLNRFCTSPILFVRLS